LLAAGLHYLTYTTSLRVIHRNFCALLVL
jgi:hypothetical protein